MKTAEEVRGRHQRKSLKGVIRGIHQRDSYVEVIRCGKQDSRK
jgi:hypothetical protein